MREDAGDSVARGQTVPQRNFREPKLSTVEQKNVDMIIAVEKRIHDELTTKPVSNAVLESLFLEDARKLRYEILARHGRIFKDRWLNDYFRSFAWYKPDPQFTDEKLNPIEKRNIAAITAYEKKAVSSMSVIEG